MLDLLPCVAIKVVDSEDTPKAAALLQPNDPQRIVKANNVDKRDLKEVDKVDGK
ncbi:MAG: hypothetical protein IPL32_03010 [Chloracidobacterium sp.]|nr:hypothetical protein [Chloracidobacterium sp.]